jgi:hypothetical protein
MKNFFYKKSLLCILTLLLIALALYEYRFFIYKTTQSKYIIMSEYILKLDRTWFFEVNTVGSQKEYEIRNAFNGGYLFTISYYDFNDLNIDEIKKSIESKNDYFLQKTVLNKTIFEYQKTIGNDNDITSVNVIIIKNENILIQYTWLTSKKYQIVQKIINNLQKNNIEIRD